MCKRDRGIVADVNLLHSNEDKEFIEIVVEPSNVPIAYHGQYHYRSGSTKQEMKGTALQQFILKKMGRSWDDTTNDSAKLDDIDRNAIDYFLRRAINAQRIAPSSVSYTHLDVYKRQTFAGLSLRNPIIISSSGLTNSVGKNKKLAEDGAGAIVLKSLFEEQIMLEADQLKDPAFYPEASDYLEEYIREHKLSEYLTLIKESKKVCPIPIIASINCYTDSEWVDFAKKIEEAGADALEINILALQSELQYTYGCLLYTSFISLICVNPCNLW